MLPQIFVTKNIVNNTEVNEEDIQKVSPNSINDETIPRNVQVSEDNGQNISSNICYEATEKIISKKNECYATLKDVGKMHGNFEALFPRQKNQQTCFYCILM